MRNWLKAAAAAAAIAMLAGCGGNHYNVPRETYERKVRTIGVAPIFLDENSDVAHPAKAELLPLLKEFNRRNEKRLVEGLIDGGGYFSVRLLDADADKLFSRLLSRRERREDAGVAYNKYFYKQEEVRALLKENHLDAVMLVTLSGIIRQDSVRASNPLLGAAQGDYNHLILTAVIIDSDGMTMWEYPNFRKTFLSLPPLLALQYPDFDEAEANLLKDVELKFKTIAGIRRALERKEKDLLLRDKVYSRDYATVFTDMLSLLKPETTLFGGSKEEKPKAK